MRNIEILTTHNVTINYELAEARERIFANIVDLILLVILIIVINVVNSAFLLFDNESVFNLLITMPLLIFYHLAIEVAMDGQSFGKRLLGLKVVKLNGAEPSINDYLMRWTLRPIDILFSLGSIGIMLISSSEKGQRLGDLVANTTVVKVNPSQRVKLSDIMNIKNAENYTPVYPGARQFTEQEMLLLKEVLDKSRKFKNDAHYDALSEAVDAVKDRLGLDRVPTDKAEFIRTLIKDYVALSR